MVYYKLSTIIAFLLCIGYASQSATQAEPIRIKSTKYMACKEKTAIVAVIDTGFGSDIAPQYALDSMKSAKLCRTGHKNFTSDTDTYNVNGIEVPADNHGHGTNIAGVIQDNAGNSDYCMVIIKYYSPKVQHDDNLINTIKAINYATSIGANYINYSGGGTETNKEEIQAVKTFLDKGGKFIAAAGNERSDMSRWPYYPAMDDKRVISVGNKGADDKPVPSSNYGKPVTRWEYGTKVVGFGIQLTGTSQAAAIATGKIINDSECDK